MNEKYFYGIMGKYCLDCPGLPRIIVVRNGTTPISSQNLQSVNYL